MHVKASDEPVVEHGLRCRCCDLPNSSQGNGSCFDAVLTRCIRQIDGATLEDFEQYAEMLLVVSVCVFLGFIRVVLSEVVFQDLIQAADEVIFQGIIDLEIEGVDYYASAAKVQDLYCCDELLIQMSQW